MHEKDSPTVQKGLLTPRAWLTNGFRAAAPGLGAMALNAGGDLNPFMANAMSDLTAGDLNYAGDRISFRLLFASFAVFACASAFQAQTKLRAALDLDGDGKTDPAVWRETDGVFYVLKSVDASVAATNWGLISDLPLAAYDTH